MYILSFKVLLTPYARNENAEQCVRRNFAHKIYLIFVKILNLSEKNVSSV